MINLSIPNKILNQLSKQNKYITPVSASDLPLFQSFFRKEKHTYGNSWTYVTQGVYGLGPHNLGYKYYDGKNLSLVGIYPKLEQPELNVFYWVRPMGPTVLDVITDFSGKLLAKDAIPTYVKKIFKEQFDYLEKKGFKDTKNFPWHTSSYVEDDTYPEIIYEAKSTLDKLLEFPKRNSAKRVLKKMDLLKEKYGIIISDKDFEKNAWMIAETFFHSPTVKSKNINLSTEYDYYNMIFADKKRPELVRKIVYSHNTAVGFYALEKIDNLYTCLYSLLILRDRLKFLSDYVFLTILKNVETKYINGGGSENQGIHDFKMKFTPFAKHQMYWVTNFKS